MSNWLISKTPHQAARMFKNFARFMDLLAQKNLYIIEGVNPFNWHVNVNGDEPMFLCHHFILNKQEIERLQKD